MSSNSIPSADQTQMTKIIKEFLFDLHRLSVLAVEGSSGFYHVDKVYDSAYDFGRFIHLYPEFLQLLSNEDKNLVKEHFPNALSKLVGFTPGLVNGIQWNVNSARTKRSQIWFIKNEILDLYKQVNENHLSKEVENDLDELQKSDNTLEDKISNLADPDNDDTDDDPKDVPNLNGVPLDHDWWPEEHRELWENKQ